MESSAQQKAIVERLGASIGPSRWLLLSVGIACLVVGVLAMVLPLRLFASTIRLIGLLFLVSGAIKAFQFGMGRHAANGRHRGWLLIAEQVALDLALGALLLNHWRFSVEAVVVVLGLLFVAEGVVLALVGVRSPTRGSRWMFSVSGLITGGIGLVVLLRLVPDPLAWVGLFAGLKLVLFGGTLVVIALRAPKADAALLYEAVMPNPETGELYAVYFGTAFHLGVSVGDGRIVHFLDDSQVHHVTWEQFLEGRVPLHWTYPDLEPVPPEEVVRVALSEVGKSYPYNLLKFNCEHFAIFCKSASATKFSKYAQIPASLANVAKHPILGTVAELNTRIVEWLAFNLGGASGKKFSLTVRRIGAAVTAWLLSGGQAPLPSVRD